jgi:hypothetical protein
MATKEPTHNEKSTEFVRAVAAIDRHSDKHKKIYEDLADE